MFYSNDQVCLFAGNSIYKPKLKVMKNRSLIFFLLLFFIFGCSKENVRDNITSLQNETPNEQISLAPLHNYLAAENVQVPVEKSGKLKTKTIKFHESSGIMGIIPNPGECEPYGGLYQVVIEGTGHATHLGLFEVINTYCVGLEGNPISPIYGIMTAANGDQLFSQMTSSWIDETTGVMYYGYNIYNGNGRFEGATGNTLMWGTVDYANNTWYLEGEGNITY